jgi:hypothetical protein
VREEQREDELDDDDEDDEDDEEDDDDDPEPEAEDEEVDEEVLNELCSFRVLALHPRARFKQLFLRLEADESLPEVEDEEDVDDEDDEMDDVVGRFVLSFTIDCSNFALRERAFVDFEMTVNCGCSLATFERQLRSIGSCEGLEQTIGFELDRETLC